MWTRRRKALPHDYWPDPGPIYCWLCGETLELVDAWAKATPPPFICDRPEWEESWRKSRENPRARKHKFSLYMRASDINFQFREPLTWLGLFRISAVVLSKEDNKYLPRGYHLSGIGYMPGARIPGDYVLAGRDPGTACLGAGRQNSETLFGAVREYLYIQLAVPFIMLIRNVQSRRLQPFRDLLELLNLFLLFRINVTQVLEPQLLR
ncbi:predicted protein [Uncinocarpus reesii 1704]|uniref:Uncharacterized protein n=1 Tax=Uncinocarpus reesii (strain UAMH 1704) TaxID=336963 RepID=C4JWK8_UNCRE|nr:uncharacterized protein UREG_06950 [Uncinocarpus reesii 1704]EEP82085.1 predicted protein [Uncinocarpus reesii 1704]